MRRPQTRHIKPLDPRLSSVYDCKGNKHKLRLNMRIPLDRKLPHRDKIRQAPE